MCFQLLLTLCTRCCCIDHTDSYITSVDNLNDDGEDAATANAVVPRVAVEMLRVQMFLQVGT